MKNEFAMEFDLLKTDLITFRVETWEIICSYSQASENIIGDQMVQLQFINRIITETKQILCSEFENLEWEEIYTKFLKSNDTKIYVIIKFIDIT
jgi:hypothetical protein